MTNAVIEVDNDYLALVRRFPLRDIRNKSEQSLAKRILSELMDKEEGVSLSSGEVDYGRMLARQISEYERSLLSRREASALDVLRTLMDARGMRAADLGRLIGKSQATEVLQGKRDLSKSHIRALANHFQVSAALFL
jgi:antitoxin component HigA of HigAB toxin-antitoxin module